MYQRMEISSDTIVKTNFEMKLWTDIRKVCTIVEQYSWVFFLLFTK